MAKVLVLYYSSYGHIETMAAAMAEGARSVAGADVTVKRVPELVPDEVAKAAGIRLDQAAPIASPGELGDYDAIITITVDNPDVASWDMAEILAKIKIGDEVQSAGTSTGKMKNSKAWRPKTPSSKPRSTWICSRQCLETLRV